MVLNLQPLMKISNHRKLLADQLHSHLNGHTDKSSIADVTNASTYLSLLTDEMVDEKCRYCSAMRDESIQFENSSGCVHKSEMPLQYPREAFKFHCSPKKENDSNSTRKSTTRGTFRSKRDSSEGSTVCYLCCCQNTFILDTDNCCKQIFEQSKSISHRESSCVSRSYTTSYVNKDLVGGMQNRNVVCDTIADENPLVQSDGFVDVDETLNISSPELPRVSGQALASTCSADKSRPISHFVEQDRSHADVKHYFCGNCCKQFRRSANLQTHLRIHTGEKPYSCSYCSKKFTQLSNLRKHERIHTGEKPYTCCHCSAKFSNASTVARHKRIHTGERPYTCSYCSKKFTQLASLKTHKRIHTGEKPYTCCYCFAKFSDASTLVRHKRIHTGEKPYTCSYCSKKFTQLASLKTHKRIHTGEKPYTCCYCFSKFSHASTLVRHKRIHTGEKLYSCCRCPKKFTQSATHERIHIGEKPDTSTYCCFEQFTQLANEEINKRIHSDEKLNSYRHSSKNLK
jgi:uncharacterized Zn-finger protein